MPCKKFGIFILTAMLVAMTEHFVMADQQGKMPDNMPIQTMVPTGSVHDMDRKVAKTIDIICAKPSPIIGADRRIEISLPVALRNWLDGLLPFQKERASQILREARPIMQTLREAIKDKKSEMAELSYDHNTMPETLPRLGMELQELRLNLRNKLETLCNRLFFEAGVNMNALRRAGFCFLPSVNDFKPSMTRSGHHPKIS